MANCGDVLIMSMNGYDGLPPSLEAFMLQHLNMHGEPEPIQLPEATSRTISYESRTSETNSEISAVVKTMLAAGCAHAEIKEVVAILANKTTFSYDNRTSLVRETDAELKLRRKQAYDRDYQKLRYETRAQRTESKNLVRDKNVGVSIRDSKDTIEKKETKKVRGSGIRARGEYPADFEKFWKSYPRTPVMGKAETFAVWKKIPAEERELAAAAVPKFVAWLKTQKPDYPVIHACRFLSKKRFDGFQVAPALPANAPPWERQGITEEQWRKNTEAANGNKI